MKNKGLYTPELESDACGIGMICKIDGEVNNSIVDDALTMLENMEHRGANGYEENTGDGAGILLKLPHQFFQSYAHSINSSLPNEGQYGVGFLFLPQENDLRHYCKNICDSIIRQEGFESLFYRQVPTNNTLLGNSAKSTEPFMEQVFINSNVPIDERSFEKKMFLLRIKITREIIKHYPSVIETFYFASLSSKTIVYKGQLSATQVRAYYPDLSDPNFATSLALVHSRFSTNTVPKWKLAQPFRYIAHNGEINTLQGNINWWNAREAGFSTDEIQQNKIEGVIPVCARSLSDSGNFDGVLEFLKNVGYSLPHALLMMIPKAWHNDATIPDAQRSFYEYHEYKMEPWDGPASMCFTDGFLLGATLDRNGLRPSKYFLTTDNVLVLASESGALPYPQNKIKHKKNLQPGQLLLIDLEHKKILDDADLNKLVYSSKPFAKWLEKDITHENGLQGMPVKSVHNIELAARLKAAGITREDEEIILRSMIINASEPIGSMGSDIPLAVLSTQAQHISNYFKQLFAQVTNPPIDPLRERTYMDLSTYLGGSLSILEHQSQNTKIVRLSSPFIDSYIYSKVKRNSFEGITSKKVVCTFDPSSPLNLKTSLDTVCKDALIAIESGAKILILDNTLLSEKVASIPMLLAIGAVNQSLIESGHRRKISLIAKTAETVEVHHFATLIAYGADAIYPELTLDYINTYASKNNLDSAQLIKNYAFSIEKGLLKIMSKLGISTILSYKGSQAYEILGISSEVVSKCFRGTISRIEGMTFEQLAKEQLHKHSLAFNSSIVLLDEGKYQWNRKGEFHLFNPHSIHLLQYSTSSGDYEIFKKYTSAINDQSVRACTLRSLFKFKQTTSISIDEVEPIENIFKRFATGAMSFGSISEEAHTTLAIAMNRIGGKSNSGEGGEDAKRYIVKENGDRMRSAIKQVASGRFGVTIQYLNNADEIQIKMAQGAKPGEGGQLPGHKVDENIARVRHSTPGVGLISPPPHHDIYSIEDLAQLIFDLKNANEKANISVKLVSKAGVGIIASGVAKAHADHILISGFDGGTGASPLSSTVHAGLPWELGLAETHQTLMKNGLRDRVRLQTDGQLRTGRDLAIATLLGAEEWGIATAALVVSGCILMRKCHLNTCPVGIATQDLLLREKYNGKVEHLVNYFTFLAENLREIMAELGFRTVDEMVGRSDLLFADHKTSHWKYKNLDLSSIFYQEKTPYPTTSYKSEPQNHGLENILDRKLIKYSTLAIIDNIEITNTFDITNINRSVGTMLSSFITRKYGDCDLPEDRSLKFKFRGSAGQSFGAFGIKGLEFLLEGEANDYVGKGLSGAVLGVIPDREATFTPDKNIIIGNVALFGATSGKIFINGRAGERFAVRNSGASAVVEGIGANGCEYMTGGRVVILGDVGRNFAAGMSGGIAYILAQKQKLSANLNCEMVEMTICNAQDYLEIQALIQEHFNITASAQALTILQNWEKLKKGFFKVISHEFKKILIAKSLSANTRLAIKSTLNN